MQGITFGEYHSYDDFGLLLVPGGIEDNPPEVQENYIEVPYRNTLLDMTEAFGKISYSSRKPSFEFQVIKSGGWESVLRGITHAIHGRKIKIVYDRDPDYYLYGRVGVNEFKSDKNIGTVVIGATCDPFKYKKNITTKNFTVSGSQTVMLDNAYMTVYPKITTTAEMQVVQGDTSYEFGVVTNYQSKIKLDAGETSLTVSGTGTITFTYQEGVF